MSERYPLTKFIAMYPQWPSLVPSAWHKRTVDFLTDNVTDPERHWTLTGCNMWDQRCTANPLVDLQDLYFSMPFEIASGYMASSTLLVTLQIQLLYQLFEATLGSCAGESPWESGRRRRGNRKDPPTIDTTESDWRKFCKEGFFLDSTDVVDVESGVTDHVHTPSKTVSLFSVDAIQELLRTPFDFHVCPDVRDGTILFLGDKFAGNLHENGSVNCNQDYCVLDVK